VVCRRRSISESQDRPRIDPNKLFANDPVGASFAASDGAFSFKTVQEDCHMAESRARQGFASLIHVPVVLFALACGSGAAHADASTPLGDITGTVGLKFQRWASGDSDALLTTINPVNGNVSTTATGWTLSVPLPVLQDSYPGQVWNAAYTIGGSVSLTRLPTFAPASGLQAGDISVTIEGNYTTQHDAFIMFNPDFTTPGGYPSVKGSGSFAFTKSLAEIQANDDVIVNWTGSYAGSSSAIINVTSIKLSQAVTAVPEPSSALLMALGLAGLGLFARRAHRG
jgi:hypothetical protein